MKCLIGLIFIIALTFPSCIGQNFAYHASVKHSKYNIHLCNGAIVSPRWILTAAQCVYGLDVKYTEIHYGEYTPSSTKTNKVLSIYIHPEYNSVNLKNNIALIKTVNHIGFIPNVIEPIDIELRPIDDGETVFITGWNWEKTGDAGEVLSNMTTKILPFDECELFNEAAARYAHEGLSICTKDTFNYGQSSDIGNPLVSKDKSLVAIASYFGHEEGRPDIYTLLAPFYDWFKYTIDPRFY